ncbi:hypothetical protein BDZ91DRAFT_530798 [Kalaharituber pfeilii]|nr:hypothetical protein BDZ91DRAFT_530798 [Kalaharituber pfeilii]
MKLGQHPTSCSSATSKWLGSSHSLTHVNIGPSMYINTVLCITVSSLSLVSDFSFFFSCADC